MKQYLIAHDLGTSGDKATLFTAEGEMIRSAVVSYDVDFSGDKRAEQNPLDWWNAFVRQPERFWKVFTLSRFWQFLLVPRCRDAFR